MPKWRWPERCDYELEKLQQVTGDTLTYDVDALQRGALVLRFDWLVSGGKVSLEALYPDSFPRNRPIVRLLAPPDQFPERHCSPIDGTLCLLGRESGQWVPELTLRKLLEDQLEHALNGTGTEDPQGEPGEFWWNCLSLQGSYCLVDSSWSVGQAEGGTIRLHGRFDWNDGMPLVRAAVVEISAKDVGQIAKWVNRLPPELDSGSAKTFTIPWQRVHGPFLPNGNWQQIADLAAIHPRLLQHRPIPLSLTHSLACFAVLYDTELGVDRDGLGWAFPVLFGTNNRVQRREQRKPPQPGFIRTLRSGSEDLGARVPAVRGLRDKTVAVFGLGAIGAPLAIELARNGCRRLHLIDHDVVEPGNSIRWPIGATAWGTKKSAAIEDWIKREYPWTEPIAHNHQIGLFDDPDRVEGDAALFDKIFPDVDLVVDAAASHGVTGVLGDYCRDLQIPMVSLFAAPNLEGGLVARFGLDGGCPTCLELAWAAREIAKPRGLGLDAGLQQPPGCSERTFTGASYDLQELSLQAVRLTVETLADVDAARTSRIFTLTLTDPEGAIPPRWDVTLLNKKTGCACNRHP